ncbi:MAG: aspartate/glutamate racemase family protein [bacterium]|nr:aspartate/glutamate racemase family protein [bacterium]
MRIQVINPLGVDVYNPMVERAVERSLAPDTKVEVRSLEGTGVPPTAFLPTHSRFMNQLLTQVETAERDGFDAVVIACAADPGLEDAKDLVGIPVTGPMEAAVATGRAFGRMAVVCPRIESGEDENLPQDANWIRRLVHRYGAESIFAGVFAAPSGHPPAEEVDRLLAEDPDELRAAVRAEMDTSVRTTALQAAQRAFHERDANVIFFACTLWSGLLEPIRTQVPVQVLDPLITPVLYAEMLARTTTG